MSLVFVTFVLFLVFNILPACMDAAAVSSAFWKARSIPSLVANYPLYLSVVRSSPFPRHLSLLAAGLGSAAASSAEAGLQAVDEVADDGEDEQEDDDNDRDDDVAGHFGGW